MKVPKKCPLCGENYMAERQLFTTSYEHDACERCKATAIRNSQAGQRELADAIKEVDKPC
jgi:hypothetical protein